MTALADLSVAHAVSTGPAWARAVAALVCSSVFLPLCFLISQNKFDSDESSSESGRGHVNQEHGQAAATQVLPRSNITMLIGIDVSPCVYLAASLVARQHNRTDLVLLLSKILISIGHRLSSAVVSRQPATHPHWPWGSEGRSE